MKRNLAHIFSSFQIVSFNKRYPVFSTTFFLRAGYYSLSTMELQWPEFVHASTSKVLAGICARSLFAATTSYYGRLSLILVRANAGAILLRSSSAFI